MNKVGKTARARSVKTVCEMGVTYGVGRPVVHDEDWTKVTVVLLNRQIVFLDLLAADIRATNGAAIKRAEIIRALIDTLAEADIDLTSVTTEDEIRETLRIHLGKESQSS